MGVKEFMPTPMDSFRDTEEFPAASIPSVVLSTWLIVFALGRITPATVVFEALFAIEFLRILAELAGVALLVLSRRR